MYEAIGIGVSAGGINALKHIIPILPHDYPLAVIVIQHRIHTAEDFLVEFLNNHSAIRVKEAQLGEVIKPGCVYIGPSGYHLLIERNKTFSLSIDPPVNYVMPSVDVLFESAALAYQDKFIGLIMTGANHDGSKGLAKVKKYGGMAIVQDPATAEVAVMPQAAIDIVKVDYIIPLHEMGIFFKNLKFIGET